MAEQKPIYELAGQQTDPLVEEALAILFSDRPVRSSIRPDTRSHWQWRVRDPRPNTSRLWLSFAQPLTDAVPSEVKGRIEDALSVLIPAYAKKVTATVRRVAFDEINFEIVIVRPDNREVTFGAKMEV